MANFEAYEQFLKEATTPGPKRTLPGVVVAAIDATGMLSPPLPIIRPLFLYLSPTLPFPFQYPSR